MRTLLKTAYRVERLDRGSWQEWTTVLYENMASDITAQLRSEGITARYIDISIDRACWWCGISEDECECLEATLANN